MTGATSPPAGRRIGYALLGRSFDYLLHLRPAEWPVMAFHTALGGLLAYTATPDATQLRWDGGWLGLTLWVVCLNGGTLAINSAFDRDEADIAYLRRPPPPPPHLLAWGLSLMLGGLVISLSRLPGNFSLVYAICVALSVAYSVPPLRLKAVAGADWAINMVGFGALTPLAGWLALGVPVPLWGWLVIGGFCPLFAALYPLTQLYQMEEDRARGDRTLALRLGTRASLQVAMVAALLAFACFASAGWVFGWHGADWRWLALAAALLAWLLVLIPWLRMGDRWRPEQHQGGMYRALAAWAVTDLAVAIAWLVRH